MLRSSFPPIFAELEIVEQCRQQKYTRWQPEKEPASYAHFASQCFFNCILKIYISILISQEIIFSSILHFKFNLKFDFDIVRAHLLLK